ncbi:hypothetical protein CIP107549_00774 [Corynebacterium diphtheriae]|nr:hypothetical protein CIP107549_00774 [Corynebacterium diphtheriae]
MGLRSLEYEDTTKPDTRQGVFLVLVWLLGPTMGLRSHEYEDTKTNPSPGPRITSP